MTQLYKKILDWIQFTEQTEVFTLLIIKIYHSQVETSYTINPYFQSLKRSYQQENIKFQVWDSENEQFCEQTNTNLLNPRLKKLLLKHNNPGNILMIDAQQIQLIDKFSPDMLFSEMNQLILAYV